MALTPLERWRIIKEGGDPDAPTPLSLGGPAYKKPGQHCSHPKDRRAVEIGPSVGRIEMCLDCGRIVDDVDLKKEE